MEVYLKENRADGYKTKWSEWLAAWGEGAKNILPAA